MSEDHVPAPLRANAPTDVSATLTGALAAGATVAFYGIAVLPLSGTYFGALFGERGWVPYLISYLSLWAALVLILKARVLARQRRALDLELLPRLNEERITPTNALEYATRVEELGRAVPGSTLVARIRRALQHFEARREAREVVDQLTNQAQADADAVESSYTMVRVFIWAVPILGFIGTVIGIGQAVGGFSEAVGGAADLDVMKESIGSVTTGLALAFDTTLLALVMSILIMFPASSLQKAEEDFLAHVEDYCDGHLVRRLDDGSHGRTPETRVIEETIAREMGRHHAELRGWSERLGQIGETLTAHVVAGWEKVDDQLRVRQEEQLERLSRWAGERQREASEELGSTQRSLLRDFRVTLDAMAVEARRLQEQGAQRIDDQLAAIERLHRRIQEQQQQLAEAHRSQAQELGAAGDQLAHTLTRVRGEAAEARDAGVRHLEELSDRIGGLVDSARAFGRGLETMQESHSRSLRDASERLAGTLSRANEELDRLRNVGAAALTARAEEQREEDAQRERMRRQEAELRDAQLAALTESSEQLTRTLEALRGEARQIQVRLSDQLGQVGPQLGEHMEGVARELSEPWRRQIARLEQLQERVDSIAARAEAAGSSRGGDGSRLRRLLRGG